jgi:eukaryotic-like serine/threonine-protein kinase
MNEEHLRAGDTLGRYQLLVPIATGGTASVWAARMTGMRGFAKIVAAKVLLAELLDDPDAETMFLDEARLVARIRHPNVAEVLDLGEEREVLFIIMEWIDGEPLNVVAREARGRGGVPVSIALRIAKQVASGLHAAHELRDDAGELVNLVHRDVSPQNVLVGYDGQVKVIDFGVAKAASNQLRTSVGQMKGKVAYMAPEQAMGEPVDRRTDVFALGIVLFQLVTGKHPFRGDNEFQTLGRIRDKNPLPRAKSLVPSLPDDVDALIAKALSKSREGRFQTMVELQRELERVQPTTGSNNDELAAFMASLLGARGERKRLAIREAVTDVDEHRDRPSAVPQVFAESRTLDTEALATVLADLPAAARAVSLDDPSPATAPAPAPPAGAPAAGPAPAWATVGADDDPVPNFRRRMSPLPIIAIAAVILIGLGLAIWSSVDSGGDAGTGTTGEPAKKPW